MAAKKRIVWLSLAVVMLLSNCSENSNPEYTSVVRQIGETAESEVMQHPEWTHNAVGYLVDIQDQSPTGDLQGLTEGLDRLKEMGIDLLILPPVFPGEISQDSAIFNYKAYSSFYSIDEELGNLKDFSDLVSTAHSKGIHVLLSWPTGQISADNDWVRSNPQLFADDSTRKHIRPYWTGVESMDLENDTALNLTAAAWRFWIIQYKIDGFFCLDSDLAPLSFWERLRTEVEQKSNPLFLISEHADPDFHHRAFDMTCAIQLLEVMRGISEGELPPEAIDVHHEDERRKFPLNAYRKTFLTNAFLSNSEGSLQQQFGPMHRLFAVLTFTLEGMPVMYSGQEADPHQRYRLFEKDTISFEDAPHSTFYKELIQAHHKNEALWSGLSGGRYERLNTTKEEHLFAFSRTKRDNKVIVILNFSDEPQEVHFDETIDGTFSSIFNNQLLSIFTEGDVKLEPYGYQVFVK